MPDTGLSGNNMTINKKLQRRSAPKMDDQVLRALYQTVINRRDEPQEGSYTCYLLDTGIDKILKKVGEESTETIIAAKNGSKPELVGEISDLIYHIMVMMVSCGVELDDVLSELDKRSEKTGNLKKFKQVDKNT